MRHAPCDSVTWHTFFNFVHEDESGLRVQPSVGVTLAAVLAARDAVSPRHQYTVDALTAYVLVNSLLDDADRRLGGWLFAATGSLESEIREFIDLVQSASANTKFFESFSSVKQYIREVEMHRWKLVSVMPTYLYALMADGDLSRAKELAARERKSIVETSKQRGLVLHEIELQQYDDIMRAS